jgi:hypothetical protein
MNGASVALYCRDWQIGEHYANVLRASVEQRTKKLLPIHDYALIPTMITRQTADMLAIAIFAIVPRTIIR